MECSGIAGSGPTLVVHRVDRWPGATHQSNGGKEHQHMHEQSNRPRHWRRLALASTFVGIALVGGLASATPAAPVAPHTPSTTVRTADAIVPDNAGPRCGTGNSDGNVSTCITAYGSGLHVININVSAVVLNSTRTISVCLAGPNGSLGCTPPPGQGSITLSPRSEERRVGKECRSRG